MSSVRLASTGLSRVVLARYTEVTDQETVGNTSFRDKGTPCPHPHLPERQKFVPSSQSGDRSYPLVELKEVKEIGEDNLSRGDTPSRGV